MAENLWSQPVRTEVAGADRAGNDRQGNDRRHETLLNEIRIVATCVKQMLEGEGCEGYLPGVGVSS